MEQFENQKSTKIKKGSAYMSPKFASSLHLDDIQIQDKESG